MSIFSQDVLEIFGHRIFDPKNRISVCRRDPLLVLLAQEFHSDGSQASEINFYVKRE